MRLRISTFKSRNPLTSPRHCPSGVAEPTFAPSAAAVTSPVSGSITSAPAASASHSHDDHDEDDHDGHAATASTCEAHGDHWHCPSGVAEPTAAPAQTLSTASGAAASGSGSSAAQATGAAAAFGAGRQGVLAVVVGAVGAFFL